MLGTTKAAIIRLDELWGDVEKNVFECIQLTAGALEDLEYLTEHFDGFRDRAVKYFERKYFRVLSSVCPLEHLLQIYSLFPSVDEWAENRFDLKAMHFLYEQHERSRGRRRPKPRRETTSVAERDELRYQVDLRDDRIERLQADLEEANRTIVELNAKVAELEDLRPENSQLRCKVQELEALLDKSCATVR